MSEIGKALGQQKNGHTEIAFLANAYSKAEKAYQEVQEKILLHSAKLRIAKAARAHAEVERLEANPAYEPGEWSRLYTARKEAAHALCEAMGINPEHLRSALT